jgi:hypothetical protein
MLGSQRGSNNAVDRMRRLVLAGAVLAILGVVAWALWPSTAWPRAFCAPVVRVVGADANAIAVNFSHPMNRLTAAQEVQVNKLMYDINLAVGSAPTVQLRSELNRYLAELGVVLSTNIVTDAVSQFDEQARTQLKACGVTPVGS